MRFVLSFRFVTVTRGKRDTLSYHELFYPEAMVCHWETYRREIYESFANLKPFASGFRGVTKTKDLLSLPF